MKGELVATWIEGPNACLSVAVKEDNGERIEYIGRVPYADLEGLTDDETTVALTNAVTQARDSQWSAGPALPKMPEGLTLEAGPDPIQARRDRLEEEARAQIAEGATAE